MNLVKIFLDNNARVDVFDQVIDSLINLNLPGLFVVVVL